MNAEPPIVLPLFATPLGIVTVPSAGGSQSATRQSFYATVQSPAAAGEYIGVPKPG